MYLRISYVQGLCRLRLWLYLNWRNYGQRHLGHWRRTSGCQRQEWTGATVWICLNCELITYRPMILRMSNSFMQFTWVSHLYADLFCKIIFGWNVSGWSSWEWGWSSDPWDTGRSWGNSGDPIGGDQGSSESWWDLGEDRRGDISQGNEFSCGAAAPCVSESHIIEFDPGEY